MGDALSPLDRERLAEIFERAVALPAETREAFLANACADDRELRGELASLLAAHARAPARFERMTRNVLPAAVQAVADSGAPLGRTVSHYEILELIGGGGMGVVYKARDLALGRLAALKFLRAHMTADADARARLESEARAASALDHPSIAVVYEIGVAESLPGADGADQHFIAMAHYAGETIRDRIARGPLPIREALGYAIQVADGLARAHEAGIVHRDIKPANVIITERGEAKILDFGIATSTGAGRARDGVLRGTIAYMSPEQTRGDTLDHRTDLWSLGVMLYEMLTARRPFRANDHVGLVHAIRHDEPESLRRLRPDVPATLVGIVETCLEKDPDMRFRQTAELLDALRVVEADQASPRIAQRRRKRRLAAGLGTAGLGAAMVSAVLVIGGAGGTDTPAEAHGELDAALRLAVLPFTNLRADTATDYLGHALVDEIITGLGQYERVILRPSSVVQRYQGRMVDPREVGRELSVSHVLTGGYIKEGDILRVNIELVDAITGRSEWHEPMQVPYGSVFRLRELVAHHVARRLELRLTPQAQQRMTRDVPGDPVAHHLYLRALGNPYSTEEGNRYAYDLLRRSIELDSTFAPAFAALACRAFTLANMGFTAGAARNQALLEAERMFQRALSLNPDHVRALTCQALLFAETGRLEAAIEPLRHALSIQPHSSDVHISLGHLYRFAGLLEDAVRMFERVKALDPTNLRLAPAGLGYLYLRQYEHALELFALDPISPPSLLWQGMALLHMGRIPAARERFEEVARNARGGPLDLVARAHLAYLDDDPRLGIEVARALEARAVTHGASGEELYHFARLYTLFGEYDAGVRMLGLAIDHGFFPYPFMLVDPFLDPVRNDHGFQQVLTKARARHEAFRTLASM